MSETFWDMPSVDERDQRLIDSYARSGRTLDDLPYTAEWERLFDEVKGDYEGRPEAAFRRLHNLRKAGRLPKSGVRGVSPAAVKPEEAELLESLVRGTAGSLGQRDQLPFTAGFDEVHSRFNRETGRSISHHDLWRLIARLAK